MFLFSLRSVALTSLKYLVMFSRALRCLAEREATIPPFFVRHYQYQAITYEIIIETSEILTGLASTNGLAKYFDALRSTLVFLWMAGPVSHSPDHFQKLKRF